MTPQHEKDVPTFYTYHVLTPNTPANHLHPKQWDVWVAVGLS